MKNVNNQNQQAQQPQQQKTQQQKTRQQGTKKQEIVSNVEIGHEQELPETRMTR